jgi:hypothetical protein
MLDAQFWTDYTIRQPRTDQAKQLRRLLKPWLPDVTSVLEVGCNRGDNLEAFSCSAYGVEPNETARGIALDRGFSVFNATAEKLPFADGAFDLVFTMGVLIHLDNSQLPAALKEIRRVSNRYILAVEYGSHVPTPVDYRGVRAGIWRRPYGFEYLHRFSDLGLIASGFAEGLDGCKWWMLEKSGQ